MRQAAMRAIAQHYPLGVARDPGTHFVEPTVEELYNSSTFNDSPAAFVQINLNPTEIAQIGRFLRVINIAFNLQIALQRLGAAATIIEARGNDALAVENDLLELAAFELEDAFQVSADAPAQVLPQGMQGKVQTAHQKALQAASRNTPQARLNNLNVAMSFADEVNASLGSGLGFVLGEGNLMR